MAIGNSLAAVVLELGAQGELDISLQERAELEGVLSCEHPNDVAIDTVRRFLNQRPDVVKQVGVALVEKAFQFLDDELDHFEQVKKERPLKDKELEYGRTVLPQLVQSLVRLCSRPNISEDLR